MTDTRSPVPTSAEVMQASTLRIGRTLTIEERARELTERVGHLRNTLTLVGGDVTDIHYEAFRTLLETRAYQLAKQSPAKLLDDLSDLGFAWRDIARMLAVSVPALRRWRTGEAPSGEHLRAIAQLLAFAQVIRDDHLVVEPASWMEVPVVRETPITAIDLYAAGQLEVVYDLAAGNCSPDAALDRAEPGWRDKYRSEWEVGKAGDGQPYIKPKSR